MNRDTVYFFRPDNTQHNVLKVYNEAGDELSLSGDDSCGAFKHLSRTSLAVFPGGGGNMEGDEKHFVSPQDLLETLAKHLGYTLTKKQAVPTPDSALRIIDRAEVRGCMCIEAGDDGTTKHRAAQYRTFEYSRLGWVIRPCINHVYNYALSSSFTEVIVKEAY